MPPTVSVDRETDRGRCPNTADTAVAHHHERTFLVEGDVAFATFSPGPEVSPLVRTVLALRPEHVVQDRIAVQEFDFRSLHVGRDPADEQGQGLFAVNSLALMPFFPAEPSQAHPLTRIDNADNFRPVPSTTAFPVLEAVSKPDPGGWGRPKGAPRRDGSGGSDNPDPSHAEAKLVLKQPLRSDRSAAGRLMAHRKGERCSDALRDLCLNDGELVNNLRPLQRILKFVSVNWPRPCGKSGLDKTTTGVVFRPPPFVPAIRAGRTESVPRGRQGLFLDAATGPNGHVPVSGTHPFHGGGSDSAQASHTDRCGGVFDEFDDINHADAVAFASGAIPVRNPDRPAVPGGRQFLDIRSSALKAGDTRQVARRDPQGTR